MRFIPVLLIMAATAPGQTDVGKILEQGLQSAIAGLAPVSEPDQSAVLRATAEVLAKHLTFRADGTQTAVCTAAGNQQVEWKKLVVNSIIGLPITEADRLNGISKRYQANFSCDASRSWDAKTNAWGQWSPSGHVLFPSGIVVELKNGKWTAIESAQTKCFAPGPGGAVLALKREAKSDELPPGMTRGK